MAVGGGPLPSCLGDVVLKLLLHDFFVVVVEVGEELEAGDVSESRYRVLFGGDEGAGHCSDSQSAEHRIDIVPNHELEVECLVLIIVFGDLRIGGSVFVGRDGWRIHGFYEGHVALAARFVVDRIDGESEVAQ
jgi:hypothetical protein